MRINFYWEPRVEATTVEWLRAIGPANRRFLKNLFADYVDDYLRRDYSSAFGDVHIERVDQSSELREMVQEKDWDIYGRVDHITFK